MSFEAEYERAEKLFRSFHDRAPNGSDIARLKAAEDMVLRVGPFFGISYLLHGKKYFHKFNMHNRPLVYVSANGRQIHILKGGYRLTDRGFVG